MDLNEKESVGYETWNPSGIDPATLTLSEYTKLANAHDKWHDDSAYDVNVDDLNQYDHNKSNQKLIRRFRIKGLDFELYVKREKNKYTKRSNDESSPWLRDENGDILYYSDEEIERLGFQPYGFVVSIFHNDKRVAAAQDEWGAMLIRVAREYRRFGLGTILGKVARTLEPEKSSGGFSPGGYRNFVRIHREFVRDALTDGLYRQLVKSGQMTIDRVKEIVQSAKLDIRLPKSNDDYNSSNPSDWMLYADFHGMFVLYDRKLKEYYNEENHFTDEMIKGFVYVLCHNGIARIKQFGARTEKLKSYMMALAYTTAKINDCRLWVEPSEYDLPKFVYGEEEKTVGYNSKEILDGPMIDYRDAVAAENRFRRSFDRYDEFKNHMVEYAHREFQ